MSLAEKTETDWMNLAREWAFLTNPDFPQSMIIYLAEFGKYVADTTGRKT